MRACCLGCWPLSASQQSPASASNASARCLHPMGPLLMAAAGAFGWVQHARNRQTGEEVAVKFIELGPVRTLCLCICVAQGFCVRMPFDRPGPPGNASRCLRCPLRSASTKSTWSGRSSTTGCWPTPTSLASRRCLSHPRCEREGDTGWGSCNGACLPTSVTSGNKGGIA